jgi:uncharacterized membrane protein
MSQATRSKPFVHTPWRGRLIAYGAGAVAAAGTYVLAPVWVTGVTRFVAAYDAAAVLALAVFWFFGMHRHPADTQCRAAVEDPGRNVVLAVVLLSIVVGLSSAVVILGQGPKVTSVNEKTVIYALGLLAVIAGWALIHTIFVFRYAHLFYFDDDDDNEADRGLEFPGTKEPNDYDFAYFSFVIGMTFQVSDVQITDPGIRRVALLHALISFGYNTAIVALVINLLSGLFH